MANKLPWMPFYPADWTRDTLSLSLSARGAWISFVCAMWDAKPRGELTMSIEAYGRILGVSKTKAALVIKELSDRKVCDCVTLCNGDVTLICRRQVKYEKQRESTRCRVSKFRNAHTMPPCNGNVTPYISEVISHISESDKNKNKRATIKQFSKPSITEVTEYAKSIGFNLEGQKFCDYYEANGWKVGRNPMKSWQAAVRTWKNKDIEQGKFISPRNKTPPQSLKKSFDDIRNEIITKLEESTLAGGDSISRCLSACNDLYRDIPKRDNESVVNNAYEIFKHRNKK